MTSFTPNMSLNLTAEGKREMAYVGTTAEEAIEKFVNFFSNNSLSKGLTFNGTVNFLEDGSTGEFSGIVAATFTRNDIFHIKTTSGDIIALTFE